MNLNNVKTKRKAQICVSQETETVTFFLSGDIDEQGAGQLKDAFEKLSLSSIRQIVVNFRDVSYIGSAGLGKLLLLYKKVSLEGINIMVTETDNTTKEIMYELKLDSLFKIS